MGGKIWTNLKKLKKKKIIKSERIKKETSAEIMEEDLNDKDKGKGFKTYRKDPFEKYKKK